MVLLNYKEQQAFIRKIVTQHNAETLADSAVLKQIIVNEVRRRSRGAKLSLQQQSDMVDLIYNAMTGLDVLQPYFEDPDITEIMVNRPDEIYIERHGQMQQMDLRFDSREHLANVISRFFGRANKVIHERSPIADMRLPDGSRVHAVLPPAAPDGPILSIRRFTGILPRMSALVANGTLTQREADLLRTAVVDRQSIFISGGTASGKTTMLNALAAYIPPHERIVTIEDAAELELSGKHNLVRLEARKAGFDESGAITLTDLIRSSLRLRPDRIIVGEVRGKETYDMIQAMQTGHPGSMSTGHGNSPVDMLDRLSLFLMTASDLPWEASRRMVASALDLMVHLRRDSTGQRRVEAIIRINGYDNGNFMLEPYKEGV
ncbi:MAG: CpaF family protein [Clostridiaceae bacterium]|jgi:pilus assembly protein CpaF|nr:CpaF family protein [Clostridiaceae bacterium]